MKKSVFASPEIIRWISQQILPHEADVRKWLQRQFRHNFDEDDAIQEAYCRIAGIADFSLIDSGRAYFFTVVRNILLEQIRRERIIRIDLLTEIEESSIVDSGASPERVINARQELAQAQRLINQLPERCRQIFLMRKVQGLSQREVAQALGISENVVEKEVSSGLRIVLQLMQEKNAPSHLISQRSAMDLTVSSARFTSHEYPKDERGD